MKRPLLTSMLTFALLAGVSTAQQRIEEIAPEKTIAVIGGGNLSRTLANLREGGLGALWDSDEMQGMMGEMLKEMLTELDDSLEELGLVRDDLSLPQGAFGAALFMTLDDETGLEIPAHLIVADFGDGADGMNEVIQAVLGKLDEEGVEYEENDMLGRTVYSIRVGEEAMEEDVEFDEFDDPFAGMQTNPFEGAMEMLHLARSDAYFLACSDLDALTEAFERLDGRDRPALADHDDFIGAMDMVGERDLYVVAFPDKIAPLALGGDPMMMMMAPMLAGPLADLGIDEVRALALGVEVDSENALMEQQIAVYIPGEKRGIVSLLDRQSAKGDVPRFVGPDTIKYTRVNFEFAGLMDIVRDVMLGFPAMPPEVDGFMQEFGPTLDEMFGALGPDIHLITTGGGEFGEGAPLVAIRCGDADALHELLGMFGPQLGLEPREFLGQTIHADQLGMISIGVGGGFVLIGGGDAVEQGLRATGGDMPLLADEHDFTRALHALPAENVIAWGYTDTIASIEASVNQEIGIGGMIPIPGADMIDAPLPDFDLDDLPDLEFLRDHLGPTVWQLRSTDNGFLLEQFMLGAEK